MKESKTARPKLVEIMGLPNAGKTSLLGFLERFFNTQGFNVRFIQDQIKDAPVSGELNKNLWAIGRIITLIFEAKDKDYDLIVVERGVGAISASLEAFLKNDYTKTRAEMRTDRRKAEARRKEALNILKQEEDFFILIEVGLETVLKRDQQEGKTIPGKIINVEFLGLLEKAYQRLKGEELPAYRTKIIDGNLDLNLEKDAGKIKKCRDGIIKKLISLMPERKT